MGSEAEVLGFTGPSCLETETPAGLDVSQRAERELLEGQKPEAKPEERKQLLKLLSPSHVQEPLY